MVFTKNPFSHNSIRKQFLICFYLQIYSGDYELEFISNQNDTSIRGVDGTVVNTFDL